MNMNALALQNTELPANIEDIAAEVLIGRDKLDAVRAAVRAAKKLNQPTWKAMQQEAAEYGERILDYELKLKEYFSGLPKASGKRTDLQPTDTVVDRLSIKPKKEVIAELGFTQKEAERIQKLTPSAVEAAKAVARENNDIPTRTLAIQLAKEKERERREQIRETERKDNSEKVSRLHNPLEAMGMFQTIVIDPPWDWGDEGDINQMGRAKPDYATMPISEIEALPIAKISADNCHLYLWVTNRSLPKAFRLIEAWGFRYITCLTWVKPYFGIGNYFRGSTEQVLFAARGSQPLKRRDVATHFVARRGKGHSAKPDEFYNLVESCSYAPYIDIFGRKEREGWAVWGENDGS
jgi:N6-adenosine-specific RNA methylase IME4